MTVQETFLMNVEFVGALESQRVSVIVKAMSSTNVECVEAMESRKGSVIARAMCWTSAVFVEVEGSP